MLFKRKINKFADNEGVDLVENVSLEGSEVGLVKPEFTNVLGVILANSIADIRGRNVKRAILVGESIVVSMRLPRMDGFTNLKPRNSISRYKALFEKKSNKVYVAVNEKFIDGSLGNIAYAVSHDVYLDWGFRTTGKLILLGGFSSEFKTSIQIFFFEDGVLKKTEERSIDSYKSDLYSEAAAGLIDELVKSSPDTRICYASPLPQFSRSLKNIEYIDDRIFRGIKFQKLEKIKEAKKFGKLIPIVLSFTGILIYAGMVGFSWQRYSSAVEKFDSSILDPAVKEAGGVGPALITKIQQQRVFLDQTKDQISFLNKTRRLVNAIAKVNGVRISDLTVRGSLEKDKFILDEPDVKIIVSVPNTEGRRALEMGKEILETISVNTGLNLNLAKQGWWKDIENRRVFTIEGNFNGN
jgi:hypothetical protein